MVTRLPLGGPYANLLQPALETDERPEAMADVDAALLVVVDEFGSTAGVVTMEDIMEHILGREIFEKDDVAVDMRELARARLQKQSRPRRAGENEEAPASPAAPKP